MWTKAHRARQLAFERGRRYPTDLTNAEWDAVQPFLPKPSPCGRPWEVDLRDILNAIRYLARTGCGWRMLPVHFGPATMAAPSRWGDGVLVVPSLDPPPAVPNHPRPGADGGALPRGA